MLITEEYYYGIDKDIHYIDLFVTYLSKDKSEIDDIIEDLKKNEGSFTIDGIRICNKHNSIIFEGAKYPYEAKAMTRYITKDFKKTHKNMENIVNLLKDTIGSVGVKVVLNTDTDKITYTK